jgi:predicted transcriptional regulator
MRHDPLKRYRGTIFLCRARLDRLVAKREKLNQEISRVSDLVIANANFLPEEEKADQLEQLEQLVAEPPGFTESVRNILKANAIHPATALQVRDLMAKAGFNLRAYSNPLASIHTILKRLAERGEVTTSMNDSQTCYRWKANADREGPNTGSR